MPSLFQSHTSVEIVTSTAESRLIETDEGWSPYWSQEDAYELDDVRVALRCGDLKTAMRLSRVFNLPPVAV